VQYLEAALDEHLLGERVADLHAGRLVGPPSAKVSEARIDAPPMPSPPVRAP
jgi:hypothetical protein